jgi:hypothetical protein
MPRTEIERHPADKSFLRLLAKVDKIEKKIANKKVLLDNTL